ncbi:short-chain dehydrogenase [Thalassobaculum fulvum]|uniref:Short-chain dehydrogenase n=1 Tax=Thalassobaculum fulvum TaxID=1633335 RepID=A0A918XSG0_9PROT|nr:SDR family NAD(P)-dependent oxidoreductase [Thalassobaculum fulvum]GHD49647.1 short-chain dehydrogenase [Thalassobaculum fulvum]
MQPKSILITGASSGIGAALALEYAAAGTVLHLGGRRADRLEAVAAQARAAGADVRVRTIDVTDAAAVRAWVLEADDADPLDLVVANAGISAGTSGKAGGEPEDQVRAVFAANVDGVMNTVLPVLPRLQRRGRGQVALMASLAGYRGFPGAPAYCASKAAVKVFGEGLRGTLHASGVRVSVICPGYVRTPMTDANDFPMPFLMDVDRAARIIRRGLERNRPRIAFPWPMALAVTLLQAIPPAWIDPIMRRLPGKATREA